MRKLFLSSLVAAVLLCVTIVPALADSIGPTP